MAGFRIEGNTSGNVAEVDVNNNLNVVLSNTPASIGGIRNFSENDPGLATGTPYLLSPETDDDYRLRTANDVFFDEEDFTYAAQNFTKHRLDATTMTAGWAATGVTLNSGNSVAANVNIVIRTYKTFAVVGTETVALDAEVAWTWASGVAMPVNAVHEIGFGLLATATPFDVFDGVYMRYTSAGVFGVIRNNSATDTALSAAFKDYTGAQWAPVNARKYQIIIYLMARSVEFWISDPVADQLWLAVEISTPAGYGTPIASPATNFFVRQAQTTAPTISSSTVLARYNVRRGGGNISTTLNVFAARAEESTLSPGTLTTTANQTITTGSITRPTAAAPTNTTSALLAGTTLSAMLLELGTLAVGTDGILMNYQVPALPTATGASYAQNRRLRIDGINIASSVQTAFATGGFSKHFYLAWGSTSLSLAGVTADTATTKAYRRMMLPIVQAYTATQAAGTLPAGDYSKQVVFQTPIYVNPGEFIVLVTYHLGTAGTTGVLNHCVSFDYSWE